MSFDKVKYMKAYNKKFKVERRIRARKYRKDHKEKVGEITRRSRQKARLDALMAYSNGDPKCFCCGENEIVFLCLDHINNDGAAHRREWGPGNFYNKLRVQKYPKEIQLQVLCHNCNWAKHANGVCPHRRMK